MSAAAENPPGSSPWMPPIISRVGPSPLPSLQRVKEDDEGAKGMSDRAAAASGTPGKGGGSFARGAVAFCERGESWSVTAARGAVPAGSGESGAAAVSGTAESGWPQRVPQNIPAPNIAAMINAQQAHLNRLIASPVHG